MDDPPGAEPEPIEPPFPVKVYSTVRRLVDLYPATGWGCASPRRSNNNDYVTDTHGSVV